jgi:hypothetical protein
MRWSILPVGNVKHVVQIMRTEGIVRRASRVRLVVYPDPKGRPGRDGVSLPLPKDGR